MMCLAHAKWMILDLLRTPAYVVSTIAFPALFYLIFAVPESKDAASSNLLMASFCCFAVFGVIFLQFGVGVAQERSSSWYSYIQTLPLRKFDLLFARFITSLFFSVLASLGIIFLALTLTEVNLDLKSWTVFFILLQALGLTFCSMGLSLGYWADEKTSLPLGNLIYLPLSFAGGLWKPPNILPEMLKDISEYLPTRHYVEILWSVVNETSLDKSHFFYLLLFSIFFSLLAFVGRRRDYLLRLS